MTVYSRINAVAEGLCGAEGADGRSITASGGRGCQWTASRSPAVPLRIVDGTVPLLGGRGAFAPAFWAALFKSPPPPATEALPRRSQAPPEVSGGGGHM